MSWPEDVHDADWGKAGNKKLYVWTFDQISQYLAYKDEERGVEVLKRTSGSL